VVRDGRRQKTIACPTIAFVGAGIA